jgi:hypothetical protein
MACVIWQGLPSPVLRARPEERLPLARHAGLPEKGRVFCERTSFPEDALFLDPDRVAYRELALYEGIGRTFFNLATPKVPLFPCMLLQTSVSVPFWPGACAASIHDPPEYISACWQPPS